MPTARHTRRVLCAILLAFLVGGCGSGGPAAHRVRTSPAALTPAPEPAGIAWPCRSHARPDGIAAPPSAPIPIYELGSGPHTVVLSNQSDENLCSWLPFADMLARRGFRVVLYDYSSGPTTDLPALVGYLRAQGSSTVTLIGSSEGAKGSIVAGSTLTPQPDAVVSLSAESSLRGVDVAPSAARLHCATLFVTAADDPYGAATATRGFFTHSPSKHKKLIVVPGAAHGTALLADDAVVSAITRFVASAAR